MLSAKQQAFIKEYLVDLNATAAYKRAGYTAQGNSAEVNAARLLRHAQVSAAIQAAKEARAEALDISAKYVIDGIMRVTAAAEGRDKLSEALRGFELLGKHLGIFIDRTELTGKNGGPIEQKQTGGVLLVPGVMDPEAWAAMAEKQGQE